MLIINPIYDQAFKYMMDNEQIAKKVISLIIEQEVISIQSKPQETKLMYDKHKIPLSRFDFKAVIKNTEGEHVNVLIEIQKSNNPNPIIRFRRYLGKNYIKQETIIDENGKEIIVSLPIITVYILGYKIPEYDTPAIIVNNQVKDAITKEEIQVKSEFVKMLTHPCYILQIERLRHERKSKLEKFLAIFDQTKKTDDDFILALEEIDNEEEDIELIKKYLNRATYNEEMIRMLELEEDVDFEFERLEKALEDSKFEKQQIRRELVQSLNKIEEIQQKAEQANQKAEQERQKAEQECQKAEEERQKVEQKEKQIKEIIINLHKSGLSINQISEITKTPLDVVIEIISKI